MCQSKPVKPLEGSQVYSAKETKDLETMRLGGTENCENLRTLLNSLCGLCKETLERVALRTEPYSASNPLLSGTCARSRTV